MREILFRGKTEKGEWVYGFYHNETSIESSSSDRKVTRHHIYTQDFDKFVKPETVGQFTGLTDKNGKKIFEGDIVKAIQTEYDEDKEQEPIVFEVIGEMIFEDACFGLRAKHFVDFYSPMWQEDNVELEVIGNIHDNPELLGE